MRKIFLFVWVSAFFCQCHHNRSVVYEGGIPVKTEYHLTGETLNDSFMFSWPRDILIMDTVLIIHDSYKQADCFHIFSKNNGTYIKSFCKKGRGPGELLEVNSVNYNHDGRSITVFDPNLRKVIIFDILNILQGQGPRFREEIITEAPNFIKQVIRYGEQFIVKGNTDQMRYGVWDPSNGNFGNRCVDFPKLDRDRETVWALTDYSVKVRLSPDQRRLVTGTYIGGVLEIFNVEDGLLTPWAARYFFEPRYQYAEGAIPRWVTTVPETKIGFEDIFLSEQTVYGLIWETEKSSMGNSKPSIVRFDYDGVPVSRFVVDVMLDSFAVDEDHTIYGVGSNSEGLYYLNRYRI